VFLRTRGEDVLIVGDTPLHAILSDPAVLATIASPNRKLMSPKSIVASLTVHPVTMFAETVIVAESLPTAIAVLLMLKTITVNARIIRFLFIVIIPLICLICSVLSG
jgi:CBS domain containing-hemolysin-like protein